MENTQKGFAVVLLVVVVVVLGAAGYLGLKWYQSHQLIGPGLPPTIKLVSPNGGETWEIGGTKEVRWEGSGLNKRYVLEVFLTDGPTTGHLLELSPLTSSGKASIKLGENIVQGDIAQQTKPGNYKIRIVLYDKEPCLELCPPDKNPAIVLAQDISDGFIKVVDRNSPVGNVKAFTSQKLGISFNYLSRNGDTRVLESGDKVYVYPGTEAETGQWVQVFTKDKNDTLAQAIEKRFLRDYDKKNCWVELLGTKESFETATIYYPPNTDPNGPWWENYKNCPANYSAANGVSYFLMDQKHPDKLLFFSIGQYPIEGSEKEDGPLWQETIKIF